MPQLHKAYQSPVKAHPFHIHPQTPHVSTSTQCMWKSVWFEREKQLELNLMAGLVPQIIGSVVTWLEIPGAQSYYGPFKLKKIRP